MPKLQRFIMAALVLAITACSAKQAGPILEQSQPFINAGVETLSVRGCAEIAASDQQTALDVLDSVDIVATTDLAAAYAKLELEAQKPPLSFIWSSLHGVLDPLKNITGSQWTKFAQGAIASAVKGCRAGIKSKQAASWREYFWSTLHAFWSPPGGEAVS